MPIPTSILFCIQLNEAKLIHLWSEFETYDILLQNAFSVLPLQFV